MADKVDNRLKSPKVKRLQTECVVIGSRMTKGISHFSEVFVCLSRGKDLIIL